MSKGKRRANAKILTDIRLTTRRFLSLTGLCRFGMPRTGQFARRNSSPQGRLAEAVEHFE